MKGRFAIGGLSFLISITHGIVGVELLLQKMGIEFSDKKMGIKDLLQKMGIGFPNIKMGIKAFLQKMGIGFPNKKMGINCWLQKMGICQERNRRISVWPRYFRPNSFS